MGKLSIKNYLAILVVLAVSACLLLGLSAFIGSRLIANDINALLTVQQMIRNQTEADMMHDAVRADVLSALYREKNGEQAKLPDIRKELAEHAGNLRKLMAENRALPSSAEVQQQIDSTLPLVERYLQSAEKIVSEIGVQQATALQHLPVFEKDFNTLEGSMAHLTDQIEQLATQDKIATEQIIERQGQANVLIGALASILLIWRARHLSHILVKPLARLTAVATEVSHSGKLSLRVPEDAGLELAQSIRAFNQMLQSQQTLVLQLQDASLQLQACAQDMSQLSHTLSGNAAQQHDAASRISSAINQMSGSIGHVSHGAEQALARTHQAGEQASSSGNTVLQASAMIETASHTVQQVALFMSSLQQQAQGIGNVVTTISSIAEQTNMLALNAAIEAARAGESGRGFAVVADEVRNLAVRTSTATADIQTMVSGIQQASTQAITAMTQSQHQVEGSAAQARDAGHAIQLITQSTQDSADTMQHMHQQLAEQSQVSQNINQDTQDVATMAHQTLASAQQVQDKSSQLLILSDSLRQTLTRFSA